MISPKNLLIVEDDVQYSELLCAMMRMRGWTPSAVHTMADAEKFLKATKVEATIIDLSLPDSHIDNSLDQIPNLKKHGAGLVVIITGAQITPAISLMAHLSGADGILNKDELRVPGSLGRLMG